MKESYDIATSSSKIAKQHKKEVHDRKAKETVLKPADIVWEWYMTQPSGINKGLLHLSRYTAANYAPHRAYDNVILLKN